MEEIEIIIKDMILGDILSVRTDAAEILMGCGMPCDRVNDVTNEDETSISWVQIVDIHAPYWDIIHGNPEYYYAIRESLVIGMLENSGITYQQTVDQSFELKKFKV